MKEEMLFEIMGNIDERYINEAHKKDNKNSENLGLLLRFLLTLPMRRCN